MVTGSGKTVVMALLVAWSYLNRRLEPDSRHADNLLVIAPNVIVYERLREDFASARIFHSLPIIPQESKNDFALQVLRGDAREPDPVGNLFLTNIHQIYEDTGPRAWSDQSDSGTAWQGPKPTLNTATPMLEQVKRLPNLMVRNDEAHHVHDEDLVWSQTLLALHDNVKRRHDAGLTAWLDFSATPKLRTRTGPSSHG